MSPQRHVLFVSPEVSPFAGTSDLGETARAVAGRLAARGARVSLVLPKYPGPGLKPLTLETVVAELPVPMASDKVKASVARARLGECDAYFIDNAKYFLRDRVYGTENGDYLDNDERFVFFCRAVLEFVLKARLAVDVIHCHDWPTALVPLFLRTHYAQKPHFRDTATVLSLHDWTNQGQFPPESLAWTGLNWDYFTPDQLALNGKFNFLKAGVMFADALAGVLPNGPAASSRPPDAGLTAALDKRGDAYVAIAPAPGAAGWDDLAGRYLMIYEAALEQKKGVSHV